MKFLNFKMPFYEAETDTAGGAAGATQAEPTTETTTAEQAKTYTQEEVLALKTQSQKEFAAYKEKAEQEKQAAIEEALKKAKMTTDEKIRYEQEQALKALEERERNIALRELKADAAKLLADKQLPPEALEYVLAEDLKTTEKKIDGFKNILDKAFQVHAKNYFKSENPVWGTEVSTTNSIEEAFKKALSR